MAKLVYGAITSLDGFVADTEGNFDWAAPDAEVHAFVNEIERPVGTYLYGRRMYEVMRYWETAPTGGEHDAIETDYARIWQATDKIVYSTSLAEVETARTRLERQFDPAAVEELKAAADRDITVGGPTLAAHAFRAGLIDECHLFLNPVVIGSGTAALPRDVRVNLELLDVDRFGNGVVHLHYAVRS